jgi:hypothetical protein
MDRTSTTSPSGVISRVLWGQTDISRAAGTGLFDCPSEQVVRAYWHQRTRRWHTVLSIPVLPGPVVEEFIQCFSCDLTLDPRFLESEHPARQPLTDSSASVSEDPEADDVA